MSSAYYPVGIALEHQRQYIAKKVAEYVAKGKRPPKHLIVEYLRAGGELEFLWDRVRKILNKREKKKIIKKKIKTKTKQKVDKNKNYMILLGLAAIFALLFLMKKWR